MTPKSVLLAITGASGSIYGLRLAEELLKAEIDLTILISRAGFIVLKEECDLALKGSKKEIEKNLEKYFSEKGVEKHNPSYFEEDDLYAPVASGSSAPDAVIVAPCSMGSLARFASGTSGNLIERVIDVTIKEEKKLLLVPRETPLSPIHLENMLKLSRMGVTILPAMPAFYNHPETIQQQVDFIVGKILDQLKIPHTLFKRWGSR
ncbi:MAG: UbiX family flavin prenyltransferase [Desulfuromonadales bacterium]|nr:UbiX family flavin prenyltransferase [Desulfuromonadales bacterium]